MLLINPIHVGLLILISGIIRLNDHPIDDVRRLANRYEILTTSSTEPKN